MRRFALVCVLGLPAALPVIGCEERVVGVRNRYVGASSEAVTVRRATRRQQQQADGPLEATGKALSSTGDFLFGWMGEQDKPATTQIPVTPQSQQMHQPPTQPPPPVPMQPQQPRLGVPTNPMNTP